MDNRTEDEVLFEKAFEAYVLERLDQIGTEYVATESCLRITQEEKELHDKIKELLPGEARMLFTRYSDTVLEAAADQHEYYYRYGMRDSVRFIKYFLEGQG